ALPIYLIYTSSFRCGFIGPGILTVFSLYCPPFHSESILGVRGVFCFLLAGLQRNICSNSTPLRGENIELYFTVWRCKHNTVISFCTGCRLKGGSYRKVSRKLHREPGTGVLFIFNLLHKSRIMYFLL